MAYAALGCLVVSMLAMGPMGLTAVDSSLAEDGVKFYGNKNP
jgi:hypothetical protein